MTKGTACKADITTEIHEKWKVGFEHILPYWPVGFEPILPYRKVWMNLFYLIGKRISMLFHLE